jgi:hypothetical protein
MGYTHWTYELLLDFFAARGHKLLSKEYKGTEKKYEYECKCGNSSCSITIGSLRKGENNCKSCATLKRKATNLITYGCENVLQNEEVKEKRKATCIEKYGVEHPFQNEEVKEKIKATCFEKFGVERYWQSEEYLMENVVAQEKAKTTCLKKYGFPNPMQNREVFDRQQRSAFKRKPYTFPSGERIEIQGYESFALDLLQKQGLLEDDLIMGFEKMPTIMYENDGKTHRYFPDIFIPSQRKIVEVKSKYTYEVAREVTHLKIKACHIAQFSAEIWIFDDKGSLLQVISEQTI